MSESARVQTRAVTGDEAGLRLDRWFQRHFPQLSHGALQKLLRTGQVRVDGARAEVNSRLAEGQDIRVPPLAFDRRPADTPDAEARPLTKEEREIGRAHV